MLQKFYEQHSAINALPPRSYYIPFSNEKDAFECRRKSQRYLDLNGQWNIAEYQSPLDLADDFYLVKPQAEISVPSCVQIYGYDHIQYTNLSYPFPYDPPFVPNKNPTYHYQRYFDVKLNGERMYINFEGVDSCFYLYINNKFVGFSQVSHRQTEFDITDVLIDGNNKIDVVVLKWCMGSYLEDQDKMRWTGIFRDVYILSRPQGHVVDYKVETQIDGTVTFELLEGTDATVKLCGQTKQAVKGQKIEFKIEDAILWSAENPYLYQMIIISQGEYIGELVGIREVCVKDGLFLFNGKPIKLRGVNRHDFNCRTGATVTIENIIEDLTLMQKLNVNAIRTSHYPNMPEFYQLCDKYGFYVYDEADVESHGVVNRRKYDQNCNYDEIACNPIFEEAILERQQLNVIRDKNRPSVITWSLGNECSYGPNFAKALRWVKANDSRPVHYESLWHVVKEKYEEDYYYNEPLDVVSRMYPDVPWMRDGYLKDPKEKRPLVLCEYCHSMGNSPGDLKEYWDLMESSERFIGAFIWEWADHGLYYEGKGLRYGGDFGETMHDGNFCMDGIISADRKITQKSLEMKKCYEPVVFNFQDGKLTITSKLYFETINATLNLTYKDNGKIINQTKTALSIPARESITLDIQNAHVVIASITLDKDFGLLKAGEEIAREGFTGQIDCTTKTTADAVEVIEEGRYYAIKTPSATYRLDKCSAEIVSIQKDGKEVMESPLEFNLWRAPCDNDMWIKSEWRECRYYEVYSEVRSIEVKDNKFTIIGKFAPVKITPVAQYKLEYEFFDNGVSIAIDYDFIDYADNPPRVGLMAKLNSAYQNVEYYGYGPYEAYIDKKLACIKDVYSDTVDNLMVHYVKPQENGSHYGTEYMEISNGQNVVRAEGNFSFSALPYSAMTLTKYLHDWELPVSDGTYLSLDFHMAGIGSHSCGPVLAEEMKVPKKSNGKITLLIKQ